MNRIKKTFSILIICFIVFSIIGCVKKLTTNQYNTLENNFYYVYDQIAKDFYSEAIKGSNGQLISADCYHNHKSDVDKLQTILFSVEDGAVPIDKKSAYQKMNDEFLNIIFLNEDAVSCEVPYLMTEKEKQNTITHCNQFLSFNKDKIATLGLNQDTQTLSNAPKPDLELLDKTDKYENSTTYITGHIQNNTKHNYSSVYVSINLYKDNNLVGNTNDIITNLEAGGIWEFKAITIVDFNSYKIGDIHGNTN